MIAQIKTLFRYRLLIQSLVGRELKARYRGSVLGFLWSFINPLLLLLTYGLVFTYVFPGVRPKTMEPYFLFLFCGILPWTWFQSSVAEASGVLIAGGNLIKKVLFPAEVLPVVSVLANLVHFLFGLPILLLFLVYEGKLTLCGPAAAAAAARAARLHPGPGALLLGAHRPLPRPPGPPHPHPPPLVLRDRRSSTSTATCTAPCAPCCGSTR